MTTRRRPTMRTAMLAWAALATIVPVVATRAALISELPSDEGTRDLSGSPPVATLSRGPLQLLADITATSSQIADNSDVEFDLRSLSTLPPGTVVNAATLSLNVAGAQTVASPAVVTVGTYGDGDAVIGLGDFVKNTTLIGTTGLLPNGPPGTLNIPFSFDVTDFIQGLVNNRTPAVGFLLNGPAGDADAWIWGSAAPDPNQRPHLTISFTAVPEPPAALLMGLGLVGVLALVRRPRRAGGVVIVPEGGPVTGCPRA
jgi:hypothetical protein